MDRFRIDSHKLIYHPARVNEWLEGKNICPIYAEVGLTGACNHRCIFCAFDYMDYRPDYIDADCVRRFARSAASRGLKSLLFSGEGEPLMHKDAAGLIRDVHACGVDVALVTNGVFFTPEVIGVALEHLTWIKVSLDAGCPEVYARVRRTDPDDFNAVVANLREAVRVRRERNLDVTIGVQFLLLPENISDIEKACALLRDIGVDYLVIKPYSQHPASINKLDSGFRYADLFHLEKKVARYETDNFQVIFRRRTMENTEAEDKGYTECMGMPFAVHVSADAEVYPCNVFVGKKEYSFGNIALDDFGSIWDGDHRRQVMTKIKDGWDLSLCRSSCRLEHVNQYLWRLRHPGSHVNFI